jgi:cell division transport system permease protein
MILDRIWASGPEARLLPAEKLHAPTVAVMAIMTFAMLVVAAAGLALANAAGLVASGSDNRYVVQLPAGAADQLDRVVEAAESVDGVRGVTPVSEEEMRATLEGWLGVTAASSDLPVPAMATLELDAGADAQAVAQTIRAAVPQAVITAQTAELAPVLDSLRALQWLALSLVVLMAAAMAAVIVLAARGALDTHRSTVEIMHRIGAADRQVTRLFERKIAVDSIAGALAGTVVAVVLLVLLGGGIAAVVGELTLSAPLSALDLLLLAIIPVGAVLLSVAVAHWTLLSALRASL